jgi:hypothetical protein
MYSTWIHGRTVRANRTVFCNSCYIFLFLGTVYRVINRGDLEVELMMISTHLGIPLKQAWPVLGSYTIHLSRELYLHTILSLRYDIGALQVQSYQRVLAVVPRPLLVSQWLSEPEAET